MKYLTQCGGDLDEVDQDRAPVPPGACGNFRSGAMRSSAKKAVATTIMASVGLNQISRDSITVIPRTAGWRLS